MTRGFELDDGTGIEYSIHLSTDKTAEMRKEAAHSIAKEVVESYQTL